jgi:hypothetical protein
MRSYGLLLTALLQIRAARDDPSEEAFSYLNHTIKTKIISYGMNLISLKRETDNSSTATNTNHPY